MPNDVAVELFYDSAWHDLVPDDDVLAGDPIVITRGDGAESAAPRPASVSLQLDNTDDMYRTSNPESPLYGKAGRNTEMRVSVGGVVRGTVEASSWQAGQSRDFRRTPKRGSAWVDVEAGGMLERINQWSDPVKSPFTVYNTTEVDGLAGYWPMEDKKGTTRAYTPVAGAVNRTLLGVAFESQQRPPGSAPLADVRLQDNSSFFFTGGTSDATSGWQYSMVVNMTESTGFYTPMGVRTLDMAGASFSLAESTNEVTLLSYGPTLASRFTTTSSWGSYSWYGKWIMLVMRATYSAGTTTVTAYWRAADETSWQSITGNYVGVPSNLRSADGSGLPDGSTVGHIIGTNGVTTDLTDEGRFDAFLGHPGETTADRFGRLCALKGIDYTVIGADAPAAMGPQSPATLAEQLREIRDTEDGLIFDSIDDISLTFMLRSARYNQTPALALNATDLPALPREVTDYVGVHNLVTAAQRDGGEYTVEDSASPVGTLPPPDGVGEYAHKVDVNVADETNDLPQQAYWWLYRGTVDLPRFPQVVVNLAALDAAKVAEVEGVDVGSVITIDGMREYTIRLHVLGYTEVIGWPNARTITFVCAPDQQFDVGEYDDGVVRYDSASTTVKTSVGVTDTAVTFRTTDGGELWSTTDTPYDVMIAGQRNRVTSMGAASLVSGAYDQAATVVRGVDGVRKSIAAGEPIHVATPGRYAL